MNTMTNSTFNPFIRIQKGVGHSCVFRMEL